MSWLSIVLGVLELTRDPSIGEAIAKIAEWFKTLTPAQQAAYAQKFDATGGFGSSLSVACPECPEECREAEGHLLAIAANDSSFGA